ncbi:hypothetical protein ANRL2_04372 [Anaerolineae bacterium]|nr:hypothetical protein ANRL2_04372 [Anaerolineae bacterium]
MTNAVREERRKPSRATFLLQFAATAAGFLVSAYLVSTVIFDHGPSQNIAPWVRILISVVALVITLGVVLGLAYAATRGYHAWKLEGGKLLIFKREGQAPAATLELRDISTVKARDEDWDVIARAEGDDLEAVGLQETGGDLPGEAPRHHGELEIFAAGTLYVIRLDSPAEAREAARTIESAIKASKT